MNGNSETKLPVSNRLGLHARAAAKIAALASTFKADILLEKNGAKADARSILDILALDAPQSFFSIILGSIPDAPGREGSLAAK
jgi:phosphotransferase system HPr (HPr) family protein